MEGAPPRRPFRCSAFAPDGALEGAYMERLAHILEKADGLGMAVLLTLFERRQEKYFDDEYALLAALVNAAGWIGECGHKNLLVSIADAASAPFRGSVMAPENAPRLLEAFRRASGGGIPVSLGARPEFAEASSLAGEADFIPLYRMASHGTADMVRGVYKWREAGAAALPLIMAKGDALEPRYCDYGEPNLTAALREGVSWCYYEPGKGDGSSGFNCVPVNWSPDSSANKRRFFGLVGEMTSTANN